MSASISMPMIRVLPEVRSSVPLRPTTQRWIYLDVLRAIALLLVVVAHAPLRIPEHTWGYSIFYAWQRMGWCGVDLFFVLSGFLVGGLLMSEYRNQGSIRFGRFLWRRAWKIWPAYLAFLTVNLACDFLGTAGGVSQRMATVASHGWPYLLTIQNYHSPLVERIGHLWSLGVEEHFYLLLPLLMAGLIAWQRRRQHRDNPFAALPGIFVGLAVACLSARLLSWRMVPVFDEFIHHWPTHLRIDSLMAGVTLAYGVHFARPFMDSLRHRWPVILAIGMICFAPLCLPLVKYDSPLSYTLGYTLLAVGAMASVLMAWHGSEPTAGDVCRKTPHPLPIRVFARLGTCSYSIYLWHMPFGGPVAIKLRDLLGNRLHLWDSSLFYPMALAAYLAFVIGFGTVMYYLIEKPALRFRDFWTPSQRTVRQQLQLPLIASEPVRWAA